MMGGYWWLAVATVVIVTVYLIGQAIGEAWQRWRYRRKRTGG